MDHHRLTSFLVCTSVSMTKALSPQPKWRSRKVTWFSELVTIPVLSNSFILADQTKKGFELAQRQHWYQKMDFSCRLEIRMTNLPCHVWQIHILGKSKAKHVVHFLCPCWKMYRRVPRDVYPYWSCPFCLAVSVFEMYYWCSFCATSRCSLKAL